MKNDLPEKITFVTNYLAPGGAERVIALLANSFADAGYSVSLVYFKKKGDFYSLDNRISKYYLDIPGHSGNFILGIKNTRMRILKLREQIQQIAPDIVISFITDINVLTVLACRKLNVTTIISVRTNPYTYKRPLKWKIAARLFYKNTDKLVVQTERVKRFFRYLPSSKVEVIPNPLKKPKEKSEKRENKKEKIILAVGRLEYPKGLDLLIEAFSYTKAKEGWKLLIVGEGSQRAKLERLIEKNNLNSKVSLVGLQSPVDDFYSCASVFVLSSRYEGFPNSLAEAMSFGLPCISFNCDFGPAELIQHDVNGVLVENGNVNKMAEEIDRIVGNETIRDKLGKNATSIINKLDLDLIIRKWEHVFGELSNS
ncbi:MAG: glycosyltransferase family 4 protein [Bacteroidota bacterium]